MRPHKSTTRLLNIRPDSCWATSNGTSHTPENHVHIIQHDAILLTQAVPAENLQEANFKAHVTLLDKLLPNE